MLKDYKTLCQQFLKTVDTMEKSSIQLIAECLLSLNYYEEIIYSLNDSITKYHSENHCLKEQLAALQAETKEEP